MLFQEQLKALVLAHFLLFRRGGAQPFHLTLKNADIMTCLFSLRTTTALSRWLLALLVVGLGHYYRSSAQVMYALSGNLLITTDLSAPSVPMNVASVMGLATGQTLAGIDCRPATGELYGIGYNSSTGEARLYTINPMTGMATPIGMGSVMLQPNMGAITFDFNPTVDRIRVMGSNRTSYRMHPITGALLATDSMLMYAATDPNAGKMPVIVTGAYTNSYIGATATGLYNYDGALDVLTLQNPPNDGIQNTIGVCGINPAMGDVADLDIFFDKNTQTNFALLTLKSALNQTTSFFRINLTTGSAQNLTSTPLPVGIDNIAFRIDRTVPPTFSGQLAFAVTTANQLISFDTGLPEVVRTIVPLSGIAAGQVVAGLDFRPATGELYAIGYQQTTGEARLYTIDPNTGIAVPIGMGAVMLQPNMGAITFDFNPTVDRIRVMGSNGANYRMHPTTGAVVATDGNLNYAANDPNTGSMPMIATGAYTNSFNGATSTTLYNYDAALNVLTIQNPPNNGTQNTIGTSGIVVNTTPMPMLDLDIFYSFTDGSNTAYLCAAIDGNVNTRLFRIDLASGMASPIGFIGLGIPVRCMAIALDVPPQPMVFKARLSGHQEVFPVATAARGEVTAMLTGNQLTVTGSFSGLSAPIHFGIAGGAHLHAGYAGQNGPVVFPLVVVPNADSTGGTFPVTLNTFQLSQAQVQTLMQRGLYVNIHTHAFPGGELRGQVLPEADAYFSANLFGSQETPPVYSNGSGAVVMELHGDTLVVSGSFSNLDGHFASHIAGGAHLHLGLAGTNGGVLAPLKVALNADMRSGTFLAMDNALVLSAPQKAALMNREVYVNIHTEAHATGELRGQVVPMPEAVLRAHLCGANEYPFVIGLASGQIFAEIRDTQLVVSGSFSGLDGEVDEAILGGAHLHLGVAGTNGPVALELKATLDMDKKGGRFLAADNVFALDAALKQALLQRGVYINIHTTAYPAGEIRGQLLLESQAFFLASLTGSQEIPGISTRAHGAVAAELSGNRLTVSGSFADLSSPVNVAIAGGFHLHEALPGSNGPVVTHLHGELDAMMRSGVFPAAMNTIVLANEQRNMLMARGLYINVHSIQYPMGELRGNLLAEASAYFLAPLSGASESPAVNTEAIGLVAFEVRPDQLVCVGSFNNLKGDFDPNIAGGAHLHTQFAGNNGPIAAHLHTDAGANLRSGMFMADENVIILSPGLWDTLRRRMVYVNVHTKSHPSGEVRGQVLPLAGAYFHTTLDGINEMPAVLSGGIGGLKLELNGNTLTCTGSFRNLDGEFDASIAGGAHLHLGLNGTNGGVSLVLSPTVATDLKAGFFEASSNTFNLNMGQLNALFSDEFYANIHTKAVASGELRGQVLKEPNFFPSAAMLTMPTPGALIDVQGAPTDLLDIAWLPGTDPDGHLLTYVWQVATDAAFNNIVFMQSTGAALSTSLTMGALDALLMANNVPIGATVPLFHRVICTDGSNATLGAAVDVRLRRGMVVSTGEPLTGSFRTYVQPTLTHGQPIALFIESQLATSAVLRLYTPDGRLFQERTVQLSEGTQSFEIAFESLAAGVYYLVLQTPKGILPALRVVKQ